MHTICLETKISSKSDCFSATLIIPNLSYFMKNMVFPFLDVYSIMCPQSQVSTIKIWKIQTVENDR